jgi:hypothetical protein
MKKILIITLAALFLGGCTPKDLFVKPSAGLEISSIPGSTVFINEVNKGETPFSDKNMKPGAYTIKLVPSSTDGLSIYETSINLVSNASTIISRNLAASELDASGYTLQLQEDISGGTYLSIISDPDYVNITIDDKPSGFTPLSKFAINPGSHTLLITSPGYLEQKLSVNTVTGFNLIVNFKLASQTITLAQPIVATPSASIAPSSVPVVTSNIPKPYVVINETGTGWLRIRKEASGSSDELGKANTGEKLKYLGDSTELGWFKIEFEGGIGWVSGKYVTLVK